jgi:Flp pilus assembly protein TadG
MPFARFFRDRKGGVAPLLALGIIPLVGAIGAAVDYSRANAVRVLRGLAGEPAQRRVQLDRAESCEPAYFEVNGAGLK